MVNVPPCSSSILSCPSRAPLAEGGDGLLDAGKAQLIAVAHDGNDETFLGPNGDADVVIILIDQVLAVDLGVDRGNLFQRADASFDEKAHEAELYAVLLLENVFVFGSQRHHFGHVDLIEGRQHGGGILRVLQPACDGLAQPRHVDALFALGVGGRRGRSDNRRRRRGKRRLSD